jgi:type IV pilus biogenesis protein CpaD/CtpE
MIFAIFDRPLVAAGLALMLLSGCEGEPVQTVQGRLSPEIVSAHISYSFGQCSARIPSADQKRIRAFIGSAEAARAGAVIVTVPRGCSAGQDEARAGAVRKLIGSRIPRVDLRMPDPADASGTTGIVRIIQIDAIEIDQSGCSPGAGCTVANNLAAQMAYPDELLYPSGTARPTYHVPPPPQAVPTQSGGTDSTTAISGAN